MNIFKSAKRLNKYFNGFAKCVNRAIPKQHNNKLMSKIRNKISHPSKNAFNTFNIKKIAIQWISIHLNHALERELFEKVNIYNLMI